MESTPVFCGYVGIVYFPISRVFQRGIVTISLEAGDEAVYISLFVLEYNRMTSYKKIKVTKMFTACLICTQILYNLIDVTCHTSIYKQIAFHVLKFSYSGCSAKIMFGTHRRFRLYAHSLIITDYSPLILFRPSIFPAYVTTGGRGWIETRLVYRVVLKTS